MTRAEKILMGVGEAPARRGGLRIVHLRRINAGSYQVYLTVDGHYEGGADFRDARSAAAFARSAAVEEHAKVVREGFGRR